MKSTQFQKAFNPLPESRGKEVGLSNWRIQKAMAGFISNPEQLPDSNWVAVVVPGTIAQNCFTNKLDATQLDDADWWYTAESTLSELTSTFEINFAGITPLAEVWLNGDLLATGHSMFLPLCIPAPLIKGRNRWHLCFRSFTHALSQRKPRPKWKTPLVEQQQLRWYRTSLLGRMPGWTQPYPVIGLWDSVNCYAKSEIFLRDRCISAGVKDNSAWLTASFVLETDSQISGAILKVGEAEISLEIFQEDSVLQPQRWCAKVSSIIADVTPWWPHTHGSPSLMELSLLVDQKFSFSLGKVGFKSVALNQEQGKLAFIINGQEIFCRGACWTPLDAINLTNNADQLRNSLILARDAGVNMLRINGTMNYESDNFYNLCDELGILIWQDFMFANMDYPTQEPDFLALIESEVEYQLHRLSSHPCIAAYCGGNEVYMQAAMLGVPTSTYLNNFFDKTIPELCSQLHPGTVYFPSSPCGGDLPFLPNVGTSHYYGVSAYRQPLADAELSQVKFATECLAFSNIPESNTLEKIFQGKQPYMHSPLWREAVPRMASTGWDFEDVRDFYLTELYGINPIELRAYDTPRYLDYSKVITGEIMAQTIGLWRSAFTPTSGALMWFWRDLFLGAGWGIVDSLGQPKAAYYSWKRACQPRAIFLIDRGMNGLVVEIINELPEVLDARLEITGFNAQDAQTFSVTEIINLSERIQQTFNLDSLLGYFTDIPHSYRFGPIQHRLVHARLIDVKTETLLSEDFYFPRREFLQPQRHQGINISVSETEQGKFILTLLSPTFLQWVKLDIPNFQLSNNYFHLAPNSHFSVTAQAENDSTSIPLKGYLEALNLHDAVRIKC